MAKRLSCGELIILGCVLGNQQIAINTIADKVQYRVGGQAVDYVAEQARDRCRELLCLKY